MQEQMDTCYYSLCEVVSMPERRTKTEVLWNALRLIEPELEDITPLKEVALHEGAREMLKDEMLLRGMYCLTLNNKVVSVAILKRNVIDRIITLPQYRHRGYASTLIKKVERAMKLGGITHVFSPVRSDIVPLFLSIGWVKCGSGASDGTFDYCPAEDLQRYKRSTQSDRIDASKWLRHLLFQQKHLLNSTPALESLILAMQTDFDRRQTT